MNLHNNFAILFILIITFFSVLYLLDNRINESFNSIPRSPGDYCYLDEHCHSQCNELSKRCDNIDGSSYGVMRGRLCNVNERCERCEPGLLCSENICLNENDIKERASMRYAIDSKMKLLKQAANDTVQFDGYSTITDPTGSDEDIAKDILSVSSDQLAIRPGAKIYRTYHSV